MVLERKAGQGAVLKGLHFFLFVFIMLQIEEQIEKDQVMWNKEAEGKEKKKYEEYYKKKKAGDE